MAVVDVVSDVALGGTFHRENARDRARKPTANPNLTHSTSREDDERAKFARESHPVEERRERGSTAHRGREIRMLRERQGFR